MRLRALPLLLVLTGGDYALWDWSIAGGHDVLSLVAGLTLLPLAAASLALLGVGAARLLGLALERPTPRRLLRAGIGGRRLGAGRRAGPGSQAPGGGGRAGASYGARAAAQPTENAGHERPSRRLAA